MRFLTAGMIAESAARKDDFVKMGSRSYGGNNKSMDWRWLGMGICKEDRPSQDSTVVVGFCICPANNEMHWEFYPFKIKGYDQQLLPCSAELSTLKLEIHHRNPNGEALAVMSSSARQHPRPCHEPRYTAPSPSASPAAVLSLCLL